MIELCEIFSDVLIGNNPKTENQLLSFYKTTKDKNLCNLLLVQTYLPIEGKEEVIRFLLNEISVSKTDIQTIITEDSKTFNICDYYYDEMVYLGVIEFLYRKQAFDTALHFYERNCALMNRSLKIMKFVGVMYRSAGKRENAKAVYELALQKRIDDDELYNNIGTLLLDYKDYNKSKQFLTKAINVNENNKQAIKNLALCLHKSNDDISALELLKKLKDDKNYEKTGDFWSDMADVYASMSSYTKAQTYYEKAIETNPKSVKSLNNLGTVFKFQNRLANAISLFEKAYEINPNFCDALRNLAMTVSQERQEKLLPEIENKLNGELEAFDRVQMLFTKAEIYHKIHKYSIAFENYKLGNKLQKKILNYDIQGDLNTNETILALDKQWADLPAVNLVESPTPIFIVGMPRSGTTLLEQILTMNDKFFGAGELTHAGFLCTNMGLLSPDTSADSIRSFGMQYMKIVKNLSKGKPYVIDKMPLNFRLLGLILRSMKNAKVIHIKRDPIATCWSNYRMLFNSRGNSFGNDLNDVGLFYESYDKMMGYWTSHFPERIHNVNYEELVTDAESETKKLASFLNVNWSKAFLQIEKNKNPVRTASVLQVRRSIYAGSSAEWRNYEEFIPELTNRFGS